MKDYYQLFAFFNNIDGPAMDGNSAKWAPIVQVPSPQKIEALRAVDAQIASLRQTIFAEAAKAVSSYNAQADAMESEVARRDDFVWLDDALPAGATPQGDGPWDFVTKPDHPVYSGRSRLAHRAPRGSSSDSSTMPGASSRSAKVTHSLLMSISTRSNLPGS